MTRAGQLAPPWLPREQRRRIDHQLRRLMARDVCSVCGSPHDGHMAVGLDKQGNAMWTCQRCVGQVATIFGRGLDIPLPAEAKGAIADTLKRAGIAHAFVEQAFGDSAWKEDDREWFAQNPSRTHRLRLPFLGEFDGMAAEVRAGYEAVVVVRQIEPGTRVRTFLYQPMALSAPDDEAVAHAMFDLVAQSGPGELISSEELVALITKYAAFRELGQ